ncbi:ubiquitin-protein ligase E3B [Caerostris extrusa]|uniref:HECT-type E3 ubiquitin transferase n=1 Tax=Caerostris extrusa TaxID=172846 RepID=A0AAV4RN84_CAEEX|nr:ubiquitin-protein ligase E3B [Caerostris extrusa]
MVCSKSRPWLKFASLPVFMNLYRCHLVQPTKVLRHLYRIPLLKQIYLKKHWRKASSSRLSNVRYRRLGSPETTLVALTCNLYETALATLTQMKLDLLTGLCYQDMVLPNLWKFISSLGPGNGLKAFLDHLAVTTKTCSPEFQILVLFCDCATHLITEIRVSSFMSDLEKESACLTPQSTLITVHRSRIVEDGYQQLSMLPPQSLKKGVIRVKFINEQGLDEAGIDQDGVFKEFLEETIKKVFDPSLNLFRATTVYEGIVVDVPFASFFLSQVLGHTHSALYSSIDELPSLDPELYKSLTYIKHYTGELHELDLTFSIDEDCMGQIVTHELVPGGKAIPIYPLKIRLATSILWLIFVCMSKFMIKLMPF